jgi:hypothetical protein
MNEFEVAVSLRAMAIEATARLDRLPAQSVWAVWEKESVMQLIAPDMLVEANGLTIPFAVAGIILGLMLWVLGWHWHRFWIVAATTVAAGLYGLNSHQAIGPRMLAAGLLLAIAAGMLAVDLSRFLAFAAGGLGAWLVVHKVLPAFQEPLICMLCGGLLGLLLYRLQLMLFFSLVGTLVAAHSVLLLIEQLASGFNAAEWAGANYFSANIGVGAAALAGLVIQGRLARWRDEKDARAAARAWSVLSDAEKQALQSMPQRRRIWDSYRR